MLYKYKSWVANCWNLQILPEKYLKINLFCIKESVETKNIPPALFNHDREFTLQELYL